jgi:hypothetical protein
MRMSVGLTALSSLRARQGHQGHPPYHLVSLLLRIPAHDHRLDRDAASRLRDHFQDADLDDQFRPDHPVGDLVVHLDVVTFDDAVLEIAQEVAAVLGAEPAADATDDVQIPVRPHHREQ